MNSHDYQYDKIGRLSKEDELMMAHPNMDMMNVIGMAADAVTTVRIAMSRKIDSLEKEARISRFGRKESRVSSCAFVINMIDQRSNCLFEIIACCFKIGRLVRSVVEELNCSPNCHGMSFCLTFLCVFPDRPQARNFPRLQPSTP
jgi:hypothetical protein